MNCCEAQLAGRAVNAELVLLYWQIGNSIRHEILRDQRAEFGKQVVRTLAEQLTAEFGNSFNASNLWRFVQFAERFPDIEIVDAVRQLLSWSHIRIFLRLNDDLKRRFYMEMCRIEGWSTRQLEERIDSIAGCSRVARGQPVFSCRYISGHSFPPP